MSNWNLVLQDSFTGRTVPTGANGANGTNVGAPDTLGSGSWIDNNGGVYTIQTSGLLQGIPDATNTSQFLRDFLARPSGEAAQDQRIVIQIPAQTPLKTAIGGALRLQSGGDYYLASFAPLNTPNPAIEIYKVVGGTATLLGSLQTVAYTTADAYTLDVSAQGVNPTTLNITFTNTTTSTVEANYTLTDSSATLQNSTGVPGVIVYSVPAATSGMIIKANEVQIYNTGIGFSGPSSGAAGVASSNFTITPSAAYTGTVSLSDGGVGGTFTPSTLTFVASTTPQTFTYTPPSNPSTDPIIITPSASPAVTGGVFPATLSYAVPTSVALTTSNCYFSPYTFTSALKSVNEGAYFKTLMTLGSTANITLAIDTSLFSAITDNEKPYIEYSFNNGPLQNLQLTTANTAGGVVTLATAAAPGTYALQVTYRSCTPFRDHWTPVVNFTPQSLNVSAGTLSLAQPTPLPNLSIHYGDSITAGEGTEGLIQSSSHSSYCVNSDALHGFVPLLAAALDCEYGQVGFGGQGWAGGAADGVTPAFPSTWNLLYSGQSRNFATPPKYAFINHGTNGNTTGAAGVVSGFLTSFRAAVGNATKIFLMVPFNGSCVATTPSLLSEFQSYQGGAGNVTATTLDGITVYSGTFDKNTFLLNLGAEAAIGLVLPAATNTGGSISSYDTTHPSLYGSASRAALTARAMQVAIDSAGSGGGGGGGLQSNSIFVQSAGIEY